MRKDLRQRAVVLSWALNLLAGLALPLSAWGQALEPRAVFLQAEAITQPIDEPATTVFLTFDDGPHGQVTRAIADTLARFGAYGNFFLVGERAQKPWAKPILQELHDSHHLIANHTFDHSLSYATQTAFETSLQLTTDILRPYLPDSGLVFFRSPGGVWNRERSRWMNQNIDATPNLAFANYVGPIFWNAGGSQIYREGQVVDQADWLCWKKNISARACADGYLAKIKSNHARGMPSIVLMHDLDMRSAEMLQYLLFDLTLDPIAFQFKRLDMALWPFGPVPS